MRPGSRPRTAALRAFGAGLLGAGTLVAMVAAPHIARPAAAVSDPAVIHSLAEKAVPNYGLTTLGLHGWQVQSSAKVHGSGGAISRNGFTTKSWLKVQPDDGGAPGTEIEALLQNGACPKVFYSDNMKKCFGTQKTGKETVKRFAVPWWFRTTFATPNTGDHATLVVNGVVGEADVWVNGHEVATHATVQGDFTRYRFPISSLLRDGRNVLALEVHPNDPDKQFTLDNVDWTQVAPDQNTGIQFPIQLQTSSALALTDAHVNQTDAADLSTAALTVVANVSNHTASPRRGQVSATVVRPGGGAPIFVSTNVTVAAHATRTVQLTPARFPSLTVHHPQLWWPYQMGAQPLYELVTSLSAGGKLIDSSTEHFGIRRITSTLIGAGPLAPNGVRQYAINGKPFVVRGGGFSENLFLHYSSADTATQIKLLKSMGLNTLRLEGHFMPEDFYDQMDRAGILIASGYQCCDAWELSTSSPATSHQLRILQLSAKTLAQRLRNHASVFTFQWSDNNPTDAQEAVTLKAFRHEDLDVPLVSSAEYKTSKQLGWSGEKEGPYDWVPPSYWYDRSHSDFADDSSLTNVGGSWALDSEQSAGHTVPTLDSMKRFLSPADRTKLWKDPAANQYHANAETGTSGYNFGTLYNFDTALSHRYGAWTGLADYDQEAQVQNYEDVRAQFEAFLDHSTDSASPSTGTIYWMANKGWPTLLWDLYNYDYDEAGSYFGAQEANRGLHALFATDDDTVTVDNLGGSTQSGLTVESKVYAVDGTLLDDQTSGALELSSQQVATNVLTPKVPAETNPPAAPQTYFVELLLRRGTSVVDRNVYWESTQPDVVDWAKTEGNPQATMTQYGDLTALQGLATASVQVTAHTATSGSTEHTTVTITNTSSTPTVGFFLRADVRRANAAGRVVAGDSQVHPATWTSNDISLWPGESETITATYARSALHGNRPAVSVYGWNVPRQVVGAP